MERYVFFNTDSAAVLHSRDFSGTCDMFKLAADSYSLLQITGFTLKSIFKDNLYCFAKDPNHPLAVTLEFAADSTTEEDGFHFAERMLQGFMQQFGHILAGKFNKNSFKSYRKWLQLIIDQYVEPIMEKIADNSKASFLYFSFIKGNERVEGLSNDKSGMFSPTSSINTEISAIERINRPQNSSLKRKYPFMLEKDQTNTTPGQLFYRLYSKEKQQDLQFINTINTSALIASELLEFEKDALQSIDFCLTHSEIRVIRYQDMILTISHNGTLPSKEQIKQLYNWARLLVM